MAHSGNRAVFFGGALLIVWGADLIKCAINWLGVGIPLHLGLSPEMEQDYIEYQRLWLEVHGGIALIGALAGALIFIRRKTGQWLSILAGVLMLATTDLHWFAYLVPGEFHSRPFWFFFVRAPDLGYPVLIFPVLIASFIIASVVVLLAGRRHAASSLQSAI